MGAVSASRAAAGAVRVMGFKIAELGHATAGHPIARDGAFQVTVQYTGQYVARYNAAQPKLIAAVARAALEAGGAGAVPYAVAYAASAAWYVLMALSSARWGVPAYAGATAAPAQGLNLPGYGMAVNLDGALGALGEQVAHMLDGYVRMGGGEQELPGGNAAYQLARHNRGGALAGAWGEFITAMRRG